MFSCGLIKVERWIRGRSGNWGLAERLAGLLAGQLAGWVAGGRLAERPRRPAGQLASWLAACPAGQQAGKLDRKIGSKNWIEKMDRKIGSKKWIENLDRTIGS